MSGPEIACKYGCSFTHSLNRTIAKEVRMRVSRPFVICCVAIGTLILIGGQFGKAENQEKAAKAPDLAQRVVALEEKVARLEKLLAQAPLFGYPLPVPPTAPRAAPQIAPPTSPPGAIPAQPTPQLPPGVPPNAVPHEFNGSTYYIVPLGKESARNK
jgi:hypothetical protein